MQAAATTGRLASTNPNMQNVPVRTELGREIRDCFEAAPENVLTSAEHSAFTDGYAAVNSRFADAVAEEVEARGGKALVMLQDYHFYLVAGDVRKRCPDALLSHFVHIQLPGPDTRRVLPPYKL